MQTSTNLGLSLPQQSDKMSEVITALSGDMNILDALGLPLTSDGYVQGTEGTSLSYVKLTNGLVFMFGVINYGTSYPCSQTWGGAYYSDFVTVSFPINIVSQPIMFAGVVGNPIMDVWYFMYDYTESSLRGKFVCPGVWESENNNDKKLSLFIIGRWK